MKSVERHVSNKGSWPVCNLFLDQNHQRTAGRVEHVATQVGRLKDGVNLMEGRLRGEVKTKLEDVRSVLLTALSKAEESIKDIQEDVKKGIV